MGDIMQAPTGGSLSPVAIGPDLFARWIAYIDVKPKSAETYARNIKQFWKWLQAEGITAPTREDIIRFRDAMKAAGKKATTVNAYLIAVKRFFEWTGDEGIYPNIA